MSIALSVMSVLSDATSSVVAKDITARKMFVSLPLASTIGSLTKSSKYSSAAAYVSDSA